MHLSLYALISACSFLVISSEVGFKILMQGKETVCDVGSLYFELYRKGKGLCLGTEPRCIEHCRVSSGRHADYQHQCLHN